MPGSRPPVQVVLKPKLEAVKARWARRLEALRKRGGLNAALSVMLDNWVHTNFDQQGRPVGGWKPFAKGGRPGKDGQIDYQAELLRDTGRLEHSFLPFASSKVAGIGSALPYSEVHEKGTGKVPRRRILPIYKEVRWKVRAMYLTFMKKGLRK